MGKWEMVRLGDVVDVHNGFAFKSDNYCDDGIRIIRITNVQKGFVEDLQPQYYPVNEVNKKYTLFENDLLISLTGNVGRVAMLPPKYLPAALNQRVACLRIKNELCIDKMYIFSLLNSNVFENDCIVSSKGVAQKNMSTEWLKQYQIPLPPLDEQKRIAKNLDLASEIVKGYKEQLAELDKLVQSVFYEMFGDPVTNNKKFEIKLGKDFFKLSSGKPVPPEKRFETGIPAYGGNGVSWYTDNILFEQDTLIVGRVGFQSGNVRLARGPLWVTDNAMYISEYQSSEYSLDFLCALMKHIDFTRFQDAGDLKKITQKPFMQMGFISPPLSLQTRFASIVTEIEAQKAQVQQALTEAENLFNSLMQEYFE